LLAFALAIPLVLLTLFVGLTCKPAWYRPAAIDYARLEADKRDATNLLDRIGDALNAGRPIDLEISQDQANRWLTARRELPQGAELDLGPAENPFLLFDESGQVRIAATVRRGAWATVASIGVRFEVSSEGLMVRPEAARAGVIPAPQSMLKDALAVAMKNGGANFQEEDGAVRIPNDFVWPNGKRAFRIASIAVEGGALKLRLEPK
jgi:hypothetical protein